MADKTIKSPLPGIFYRKPSPDAAPFASEGDTIKPGDTIGLVEIMKSFHEIQSEESGVLERFLVETEDVVEAGDEVATLRD